MVYSDSDDFDYNTELAESYESERQERMFEMKVERDLQRELSEESNEYDYDKGGGDN